MTRVREALRLGVMLPNPLVITVSGTKFASNTRLLVSTKSSLGIGDVALPVQPAKTWPGSGTAVREYVVAMCSGCPLKFGEAAPCPLVLTITLGPVGSTLR